MVTRHLELTAEGSTGPRPLSVPVDRLIVAGWVGKDKAALGRHIAELGKLGVPAPSRTPTYMNLSPTLLTTEQEVEVVGPESSGEVECVLIRCDGRLWVGVGSDHTDRDFERFGIPASKQMCAKPLARTVWPSEEVQDHLDRLVLRSWVTAGGKRRPYQEGRLADNLAVTELLEGIPSADGMGLERFCLFCGTFPAEGGIVIGDRFEFEMEDPVLRRKIAHQYRLRVLPQYL